MELWSSLLLDTRSARLVAPAICLPAPEFHSPDSFKIIPFRWQCRSAFNLSQNELDSIVSPLAARGALMAAAVMVLLESGGN
jgi:hypothetical protein